jgi:SAM-dependent methyltransferase
MSSTASPENRESVLKDSTTQDVWEKAQQWEEAHWIHAQKMRAKFGKNLIWKVLSWFGAVPKHRGDDWNEWWKKQFDGYTFLPPHVKNAIEVGCGPYTNVRLMVDRCKIDHLVLSDPLIRTYVTFKMTFVRDMYNNAACVLDDHPLEELPFRDANFDLAVMINVLDHVRDARECMDQLLRVIQPGGILVLAQDLSREEDADALLADPGLVGHPIKMDKDWFDPWLDRFEPIVSKVLARDQGRNDHKHYATLLFAGRKKA